MVDRIPSHLNFNRNQPSSNHNHTNNNNNNNPSRPKQTTSYPEDHLPNETESEADRNRRSALPPRILPVLNYNNNNNHKPPPSGPSSFNNFNRGRGGGRYQQQPRASSNVGSWSNSINHYQPRGRGGGRGARGGRGGRGGGSYIVVPQSGTQPSKIRVGNLPLDVTEDDLSDVFRRYGM